MRFVSSGTEAVMSALRVARAATKRAHVLKFEGCYHGHADPLLVRAGSGLAGEAASDSAGVSADTISHTLVAPLDDERALDAIVDAHGGDLAAVIVEPVPANYGLLPQRREWLHHVAARAKGAGALFIMDEVITGFRLGREGAAGEFGLRPDLVCFGKVMGGGFPAAAYGGRADLMNLVAPAGPVPGRHAQCESHRHVRRPRRRSADDRAQRVEDTRTGTADSSRRCREFANARLPLDVVAQASISDPPPLESRAGPIAFRPATPPGSRSSFTARSRAVHLPPSSYESAFSMAHDNGVLARAVTALAEAAADAERE